MHDEVFFRFARPVRFNPNTDVFYDAEAKQVVVHVEAAGADPDSLTVALDENDLVITGLRVDRSWTGNASGSLLQKEIEYGPFAKRLRLPAPIDVEAASASYHDGILTITLPLSASDARPQSRVECRMQVRRIPV